MPTTSAIPELSVVVSVSPGSQGLGVTLASVLGQSLRGIECVLTCAEPSRLRVRDPRLRVIHAGPGRSDPASLRNAGLDEASAPYVVFLDAGDVLDRHAARNLLDATERTGAEVVAGRRRRRYPDGRVEPTLTRLFVETVTVDSLDERPELLADDDVAGKLFRVALLEREEMRFVPDRVHADRLFTLDAYLLARRITVLPLITVTTPAQRREYDLTPDDAVREVEDAIAVHRDLDGVLSRQRRGGLRHDKDAAFVEDELQRLAGMLPTGSDEHDRRLLEALRGYVLDLDHDAFTTRLHHLQRWFLEQHDVDGVASTADYLGRDRTLSTDLVERDGKVFWSARDRGSDLLDVTEMGFQQLSFPRLPVHSWVESVRVRRGRVLIEGCTRDQLGRVGEGTSVALSFSAFGSRRRVTVDVDRVERRDGRLHWWADIDVASTVRPRLAGERLWQVGVVLRRGGETNHRQLTALPSRVRGARVRLHPQLALVLGDELAVTTSATRAVRLRMEPGRLPARWVAALLTLFATTRRGGAAIDRVRLLGQRLTKTARSGATKSQVYRHLLVRMPRRRRQVVFDSHVSRSYSDSPRYIYEEIRRRDLPLDCIWCHRGDESQFPAGARLVRRGTWRYYLALARAAYWVDNQGFPPGLTKPRGTVYVQTWHGTALKRMGKDTPGFQRMSAQAQARSRRAAARWDYFLVRSEHDVRTLVRAFDVKGEVLRFGYPRNDLLVNAREPDDRAKIRADLGLPLDARLVLYAPTFRETYRTGRQPFELRIDLTEFARLLPDTLLLVRTHYLERPDLPPAAHAVARDVSHLPDVTPLMAAADILVTDYSSVMFDFAVTGRPMVFFTFDYDDYVNSERGVYFDLAEKAPGPLVFDDKELVKALASVDDWTVQYAERYAKFVAEFCEYDRGDAAARVVDRVFR